MSNTTSNLTILVSKIQLKIYWKNSLKTKNTRPINQEYIYLNDNHFEYDNPTLFTLSQKHENIKLLKRFQTKKSEIINKTK